MQEQLLEDFGKLDGISIEKTFKKKAEDNWKIQEESEELLHYEDKTPMKSCIKKEWLELFK